jgi:hypothetical protein
MLVVAPPICHILYQIHEYMERDDPCILPIINYYHNNNNNIYQTWNTFGALTSDASAELSVAANMPHVTNGPHALISSIT